MAKSKSRPLSAIPLTPAFVVVLAACGGQRHDPPMIPPNPPMQQQVPEAIDAGAAPVVAVDAGGPDDVGPVHYNPPPMPAPPVTATPSATPTVKGGGRKPATGPKPLPPG
jgi:hypothetical protein